MQARIDSEVHRLSLEKVFARLFKKNKHNSKKCGIIIFNLNLKGVRQ